MMQFIWNLGVRGITLVRRSPADTLLAGALALAVLGALSPLRASASPGTSSATERALALQIAAMQNATKETGDLPRAHVAGEPDEVLRVSMTAYNSLPEQTDGNPFETAMGTITRHGIVATNALPLGTYVKIPELYGDEVFIVEDRMNARYTDRVDIWMHKYEDAKKFGVKHNMKVEVYYEK